MRALWVCSYNILLFGQLAGPRFNSLQFNCIGSSTSCILFIIAVVDLISIIWERPDCKAKEDEKEGPGSQSLELLIKLPAC